MPQFEDRKFKMFRVLGGNIASQEQSVKDRLAAGIVATSREDYWEVGNGLRYSFTNGYSLPGNYVAASLTQQHVVDRHLYDDIKRESRTATDSYEDRLFILSMDQNLLLLDWRLFRAKNPLNRKTTVKRLQHLLSRAVFGSGIAPQVVLEPVQRETNKEEFLKLFYGYRVVGVSVDQFGSQEIPKDIVLVNPTRNRQLESALRELLRHDVQHPSISKLNAEAKEDGDLRSSAVIRGTAHSSEIEQLKYQNMQGRIKVRNKTEKGEFVCEIPISENDSVEDRIKIIETVIKASQGIDVEGDSVPEFEAQSAQAEFDFNTGDRD